MSTKWCDEMREYVTLLPNEIEPMPKKPKKPAHMTAEDVDKLADAMDEIFKKKSTRGAIAKIVRNVDRRKQEDDE